MNSPSIFPPVSVAHPRAPTPHQTGAARGGRGLGKLRGLALRQRGPQAPALSGPSPQLFLPLIDVKVMTQPRLLLACSL